MDWLIGQMVILAKPEGDEQAWMQILVFIVLAVFWAIGGIMKARAAKAQEKEEPQPKPQSRSGSALERYMQSGFQKAKAAQARLMKPPAFKPAAARKKDTVRQSGYQTDQPEQPKLTMHKLRPDEQVETALAAVEDEIIEIGNEEQLRMAMLHYEIFGKCVAFRESQDQVWAR
ncbi:MAG: hypothetical protein WC374_00825 [Phycisphaerae bacterium]|jgi:hypothetical protein